MNEVIEAALDDLAYWFHREPNKLHDELNAKLLTMARSTGQRTRVDFLLKPTFPHWRHWMNQ